MVETRFSKLNDVNQLVKLDKMANKEIKWWSPKSNNEFKKLINRSKKLIVIAEDKGKIIGYLDSKFKDDKNTLWIENVYVIKEYRKMNIAKNLIQYLVYNWRSIENIVLLCSDNNKRIFEKCGFKKTMNYMELTSRESFIITY